MREKLFAAIQPVNVTNCSVARFGDANDGGYLVCANLLGAVKTGYSYGINGTDEWGCQLATTLKVPVHQYDCFNVQKPACVGGEMVFHAECVGAEASVQDGRPFDSLAHQFERNGDASRHLAVKMDVEGAEWDSFLSVPDSVFDQIDQLIVEFHHVDDEKYVRAIRRLKQFFVFAHVHYNNFSCSSAITPFPAWAFEVLLVNKRLAQTDGKPGALSPLSLDAPNKPNAPDCQASRSN